MTEREILILIDLENTSLKHAISKIENIKQPYNAYAFCDFTNRKQNDNILKKYNINSIQTNHKKNKKNLVDFKLLRYAYKHIFTDKKLKQIYLFSGDGDFSDLYHFVKTKGIEIYVNSSNNISSLFALSDKDKLNIIKEEYHKFVIQSDKQIFINNIRKRIPELYTQKISKVFSFINNCKKINDIIIYCSLLIDKEKKNIINKIYLQYKDMGNDVVWNNIKLAFSNKYSRLNEIFPEQNITSVKKMIDFCKL